MVLAALILVGVVTIFLLLCVLGAMREAALLRGEVKALADLVRNPPPPSYVGAGEIPSAFSELLCAAESNRGIPRLVAFVSPGCRPCETFIEGLNSAVAGGRVAGEDLLFVVWAMSEEEAASLAARIRGPSAVDAMGTLSRACEIRATPTLLLLSSDGRRVTDYNLEGDVEWALSHLTATVSSAA